MTSCDLWRLSGGVGLEIDGEDERALTEDDVVCDVAHLCLERTLT